jgi:nucleoside-diphosphate-sugar epimerase
MIIVFGASTDIGRRLIEKLHSAGLEYRKISRTAEDSVPADLQTGERIAEAVFGAKVIVSCAHARYTEAILAAIPSSVQVVLVGSAWRYSHLPNARADQVREAEALFLASNHSGIMLHPAMIYGGNQENNIRRLLRVIRNFPVIPAPGGGCQIVCPIYVDDLVDCLFAATTKIWKDKYVFGVAGPPLQWRRMVKITAQSAGLRRLIVSIPSQPFIVALEILKNSVSIY